MSKKLVFGSHFAEDGNTWVEVGDAGSGLEIERLPGDRVEISVGSQWESFGHILSKEEVATLKQWLNEDT